MLAQSFGCPSLWSVGLVTFVLVVRHHIIAGGNGGKNCSSHSGWIENREREREREREGIRVPLVLQGHIPNKPTSFYKTPSPKSSTTSLPNVPPSGDLAFNTCALEGH
jgi:hypothetical protein